MCCDWWKRIGAFRGGLRLFDFRSNLYINFQKSKKLIFLFVTSGKKFLLIKSIIFIIIYWMAKGGRGGGGHRSGGARSHGFHSHGIGSRGHMHMGMRHRYGHRYYGGGGGGSTPNPGQTFQITVDAIAAGTAGATISNGVVVLEGGQASVINHLNTLANSQDVIMYMPQPQLPINSQMSMMGMQNQMNMQNQMGNPMQNQMEVPMPMGQMMAPPVMMVPVVDQTNVVNEVYITAVGNKTVASDSCCFLLTIIFGMFLIFPIFFMCCGWWKKMIFPKYDLDPQFYRAVGRYLRKESRCKNLVLTIVDNGFDAQKARILGQSLAGTYLTNFTFLNAALDCNYLANEADEFMVNMTPIKSMPFTSSITWGDMIL